MTMRKEKDVLEMNNEESIRKTQGSLYYYVCYELKSLELAKRTNPCIRVNTRELNRDSFTN